MHFNENAGRAQKYTESGQAIFGLYFPKWKKGGYTVRKLVQDPTFGELSEVKT